MTKDATGERRRRRRKGGLRIPSDNVPRRGDDSSADQPQPPSPEDEPRLAVSVAYAFGSDGEPTPADAAPGLPASPAEPSAASASARADAASDPVAAAVTLTPPAPVESPAAGPPPPTGGPGVPASPTLPPTAGAPGGKGAATLGSKGAAPAVDMSRTMEMPAVQLEALGLESPSGDAGDSVDIAFDEDDVGSDADSAGRAETQALSDGDIEVLALASDAADSELDAHAEAAELLVDETRKTAPLPTVAMPPELADLSEAKPVARDPASTPGNVPSAASGPLRAAGPGGPVLGNPRLGGHTARDAPSFLKPAAAAEAVPEHIELGPPVNLTADEMDRAATEPLDRETAAVARAATAPASVHELESHAGDGVEIEVQEESTGELSAEEIEELSPDELDVAKPVALLDAGESGEILTEDLLEEVDDMAADVRPAPAVAPGRAAAPAPSAPPKTPPAVPAAKPPSPPAAVEASAKPSQGAKPPPAPKPSRPAQEQTPAPPRRRKGKPWFEEIFDEDYLRTLPFLTPQATQAEAEFVHESLGLKPGQQILDVGCGYGRHAMELAARGIHVVALDSSLPLLLRGADEAQRRSLDINFVHGDMRELTFESQFDGAYCLFSTFGYFDDETNKRAAQAIANSLKPGGRLLIEVLNRDYIIGDLPSRVWWEGDGCVVLEEVDFNYFSSRVVSHRSVVFDDGRQLEQEISLRSYSLHEFGKLMHAAGFRVLEISGGMALRGRFFGNQSRDIIVLAEKRSNSTD